MEATHWEIDGRTGQAHTSFPGEPAPVIPLRPEPADADWGWLASRGEYPRVRAARLASRRPSLADFSPLETVQWLQTEVERGRMTGYQPSSLDALVAAELDRRRANPSPALGECDPVLVVLQWWEQRHRARAFEKTAKVLELARAAVPRENEVAAQFLEAAAQAAGSPLLRMHAVELLRSVAAWAGADGGRFLDSALAAEADAAS